MTTQTEKPVDVNETHDDANESVDEIEVITVTTPVETREQLLAARAIKRAERHEQNHKAAEKHGVVGNKLLDMKDYNGAASCYLDAIKLWPSNPRYHSQLSVCYFHLKHFPEAEQAATGALVLDPRAIEPRYRRGLARVEQRLLKAAKLDFDVVLREDPAHAAAKASLNVVLALLHASTKLGIHQISGFPAACLMEEPDYEFPHVGDDKLELASLSDSSECNQVGNGVACRFYNHEGCKRGAKCIFSHAPDEKSVRDDLGKNVCIYYLVDACKFGEVKCIYSHSRLNLPKYGWWSDEKRTTKVKEVIARAEEMAREQYALGKLLHKLEIQSNRNQQRRRKRGKSVGAGTGAAPAQKPTHKKSKSKGGKRGNPVFAHIRQLSNTSSGNSEYEQRLLNGGFTDYQLNELVCQGVKPWDDDAWDVLHALEY